VKDKAQAKADTECQADDFIHLDLAGDIFRALLKQDFDSTCATTYNSLVKC
jgi:hypothetical protein